MGDPAVWRAPGPGGRSKGLLRVRGPIFEHAGDDLRPIAGRDGDERAAQARLYCLYGMNGRPSACACCRRRNSRLKKPRLPALRAIDPGCRIVLAVPHVLCKL